jgi:Subtilisin-like serine proteases
MFSLKNKLEPNLKQAIENKIYKTYRVNILCKTLQSNIEKKIKTYKGTVIRSIPSINIICAKLTPHAIDRLLEYPEVSYIELDFHAALCGSSILSSNGLSFQEKFKATGKGIGIGLIDSGVFPHPDLLNPVNKIKYFEDMINGYKYPYDDNGHGTFISGILCGSGLASKGMYKGLAVDSGIYCIKAFNAIGKGYVSDILYALDCLINMSTESNIRVLCLPFEIQCYNYLIINAFSKLFDTAIKKGIIPVVPSGNGGSSEGSITGIATLNNCVTVGGLDTTNNVSAYQYSSIGPCGKVDKPDLSAGCVDICSLNSNVNYISERNGMKLFPHPLEKPYTIYTGTSCSSAYVSSICALLLENNPQLSFKDILSLLKISCTLLNLSKWVQGSGTIDLHKLLP